jgi:hypothetical protein
MDFYEQGRRLGLKGKQLHEFAMDERRQHELEMKRLELQLQREKEGEKEEQEAKLREKELDTQLELAQIQHGQANPDREQQVPKCLKIPPFVEGQDQIDTYLARFERFAKSMEWREEDWAIRLSALLTGDALEAYTRLSDDDAAKYETVKEALLLCYNFTDKGYRQRFRECRPKPGEMPRQLVARLSSYLRKRPPEKRGHRDCGHQGCGDSTRKGRYTVSDRGPPPGVWTEMSEDCDSEKAVDRVSDECQC